MTSEEEVRAIFMRQMKARQEYRRLRNDLICQCIDRDPKLSMQKIWPMVGKALDKYLTELEEANVEVTIFRAINGTDEREEEPETMKETETYSLDF